MFYPVLLCRCVGDQVLSNHNEAKEEGMFTACIAVYAAAVLTCRFFFFFFFSFFFSLCPAVLMAVFSPCTYCCVVDQAWSHYIVKKHSPYV